MTLSPPSSPIAIIGIAFRFPGDIESEANLWSALIEQRDLVTHVPPQRWAVDTFYHPKRNEAGRSVTFAAGVLSDIDGFDAGFFGISPREAAWLDPQQRILLELSWQAMENAGVPPSSLAGTNCAVYVGISSLDYGTRSLDDFASISPHLMTGNTLSVAANRISYFFDLHGPSLAVDTACSSSLVALHHACRALQAGEAGIALVGGVNLLLHPYPFIGFTKASMLSADGRCKTFDASGNGYVRAEGGAVLLLKPYEQAVADGDDIQAVILASGANADGARKTGITIPSSEGQAELMRRVLAQSGLNAQDVDFIEAHGTGTAIGDPVETAAIGAVYGRSGRTQALPIGSVKANLGHMEAASGMAGLVKAILALQRHALPPQIHLDTLNPEIDFAGLNLLPVQDYLPLVHTTGQDAPLVAGVNSFGFGGSNAHVLLQEYRRPAYAAHHAAAQAVETLPPLLLSTRSGDALRALAERYAPQVAGQDATAYYDLAYAAAYQRDHLEKRLAVLASSPEEVANKLVAFALGDAPEGVIEEETLPQPGDIAFVYSGNGAQWVGMGRRLLAESPQFAALLAAVDEQMQPEAGFSVLDELRADAATSRMAETEVAQPLLFAMQVALTQLLQTWGITPAAVAGHSVGEVAAAWACGALDLQTAIRVIVARSRAQGLTRGSGRMAAVGCSVDAMQTTLAALGSALDVTIAGVNSPNNLTLAGSLADLERVQVALQAEHVFFRLLDLDYAFHSPHMEPTQAVLLEQLTGVTSRSAIQVAFVSTVTGEPLAGTPLDAHYWWRNVREPVQFSRAVTTLAGMGCRTFVEIGPHAILQRYLTENLATAGVKGRVLPTLRKEADGAARIAETAMRAHLLCAKPALACFFPHPGRRVRLPNYPWQRERHWHPRTSESLHAFDRQREHPLLGWRAPNAEQTWENVLDTTILPWLADHQVGGAVVFPGAAYAEMALAAAKNWLGGEWQALEELDIVAPMVLDAEQARTLRFTLNTRDGSFQMLSRQRLSQDDWTLHASGRILQTDVPCVSSRIPHVVKLTQTTAIAAADHYRRASQLGLEYGPAFRALHEAVCTDTVLQAELALPAGLEYEAYALHPALLDVCYQSLVDFFREDIDAGRGMALLPVKMERIECFRPGVLPTSFRARLVRGSARSVTADFELFDVDHSLVARLHHCRFRAAPLPRPESTPAMRWRMVPWLVPHPAAHQVSALPTPDALATHLRQTLAADETARRVWYQQALPLLEAFVVSAAFEACQSLLAQHPDALQTLLAAPDAYTRWLTGLLRTEGLLTAHAERWQLTPDSDLPPADAIWRTLEREQGTALPQLVLLGRLGLHLPELLQHPENRPAFLETLRTLPAAEMLYQDDPCYAAVRQASEQLLCHLAKTLPAHHRLRVLEIAAGASNIASAVLPLLGADRLAYTLAVPAAAAERQQAEFAGHPNITLLALDESSGQLPSDTALSGPFDIILIRHCLHHSANPNATLQHIRQYLAEDGVLLLAERHPDWSADLIEGLAPNWWQNAPETGNAPLSSLASPAGWRAVLETAGFADIHDIVEPAAAELPVGAYLLLARAPHQSATLPPPAPASWLLLQDESSAALAAALADTLRAQNQHVTVACQLPEEAALAGVQHVVHLRGWAYAPDEATTPLAEVLTLVQHLATYSTQTATDTPRLWLLTQGGALASTLPPGGSLPHPAQTALWGFGRVVMNEHPALGTTLIDVGDSAIADLIPRLSNELLYPDGSVEILLTQSARYTLVMREEQADMPTPAVAHERFRLDFHQPGQLRNLRWLPQPAAASLHAEEVEVQVQATGLNFRDVMYLMGLLPDEVVEQGFAGATLGLEFSGVVSRVGARVHHLQEGDRVMGFGSACFASHVVTRANAVAKIPENWSFAAAATVPTVFFTVHYALTHLAQLQPGERILIHGGAGGVGIAAIQLAKHLGAEVFATAGSPEKRDFVRLLGADHVFDSRNLAFADAILEATSGEGVDVVLNSLAGEAMCRSIAILKSFGRFLELGKRDFVTNTPVGLRPFRNNISYFGIDADQLLTARPDLAARLFGEVMTLFHEGILTPLPHRIFAANQVVEAFRCMQQARHIGKLVLSFTASNMPAIAHPTPASTAPFPRGGTWLVTGGTAGFGLAAARWLAQNGAEKLILVSRHGTDPGVEDLRAQGIQVEIAACDVSDAEAVRHLLATRAPLTGIVHAAAVFNDALIAHLNPARLETVLSPKLSGAWTLHKNCQTSSTQFVLFSSVTTFFGNPGQGNYVAANAGLEGLAALRRALGLPVTCVSWGPIGDAGVLVRQTGVREGLAGRLGRAPLSAVRALAALPSVWGECVAVGDLDWGTLGRVLPSGDCGRFALLGHGGAVGDDGGDVRALVAGLPLGEAAALVAQWVVQEVAQVLAVAPERVGRDRPLQDFGLDSLMAVELALGLERRFGVRLPVLALGEAPSVEKISLRIAQQLLGEGGAEVAVGAGAVVVDLARRHGVEVAGDEVQAIAAVVEGRR